MAKTEVKFCCFISQESQGSIEQKIIKTLVPFDWDKREVLWLYDVFYFWSIVFYTSLKYKAGQNTKEDCAEKTKEVITTELVSRIKCKTSESVHSPAFPIPQSTWTKMTSEC